MVVFFAVPVNLLGEVIVDAAGSQSIVSQISVALILIVFLVLGHIMSLVLSRQYGHVAVSKMDVSGASIYFWLLLLNLFVSNLSSTPLWTELNNWVRSPKLIVDELIGKVLNTSSFFLQFCMLRCAQSAPLELIHPPVHLGLAVKTLVHSLRAGEKPTEKMIRNWTEPENTPLHRVPAQTMMVAFLGIMYCVMAPVILPVCGIFFSLFYLFWKHNLCYHYTQPYASGQTLWPWLVKHTYACLLMSQTILLLGLPTLVGEEHMRRPSVRWMRLALCPLPILSTLQLARTMQTLRESFKVPVHKHAISELEDAASAATAQSGKYDERHFDERGVVGDVGKLIKRGLRLPGSPAAGTPVPRDHAGEVLGDANRANSVVGSFFGSASLSFGKSRSTSSAAAETPGGADRKSSYNSQSAPLEKTTRRLNLSTEEARSEVQRLIDLGVWRNYQPISIWPQVNEKAAASLIVKRWREKKGVRLRIARRRADEAFRGHGGASGETPRTPSRPPRTRGSSAWRPTRETRRVFLLYTFKKRTVIRIQSRSARRARDVDVSSSLLRAQPDALGSRHRGDGLGDARPALPHARARAVEPHSRACGFRNRRCAFRRAERRRRHRPPGGRRARADAGRRGVPTRIPAPAARLESRAPPAAARRSPRLDARSAGRPRDPRRRTPRRRRKRVLDTRTIEARRRGRRRVVGVGDVVGVSGDRLETAAFARAACLAPPSSDPDPSRITPAETKFDASVFFSLSSCLCPPSLPARAPRYPSQFPPGTYSPPPPPPRARRARRPPPARARGAHAPRVPSPRARRPARTRPRCAPSGRTAARPRGLEPDVRGAAQHEHAKHLGDGARRGNRVGRAAATARRAALAACQGRSLGPKRSGPREDLRAPNIVAVVAALHGLVLLLGLGVQPRGGRRRHRAAGEVDAAHQTQARGPADARPLFVGKHASSVPSEGTNASSSSSSSLPSSPSSRT